RVHGSSQSPRAVSSDQPAAGQKRPIAALSSAPDTTKSREEDLHKPCLSSPFHLNSQSQSQSQSQLQSQSQSQSHSQDQDQSQTESESQSQSQSHLIPSLSQSQPVHSQQSLSSLLNISFASAPVSQDTALDKMSSDATMLPVDTASTSTATTTPTAVTAATAPTGAADIDATVDASRVERDEQHQHQQQQQQQQQPQEQQSKHDEQAHSQEPTKQSSGHATSRRLSSSSPSSLTNTTVPSDPAARKEFIRQ
ncbi:Cell wall assembly regulator, partial [Ascosphaera pollenicola]